MQQAALPILPPISKCPFNMDILFGPPVPNTQLDVHFDLEGSGGKLNTLQETCAIGFFGVNSETGQDVLVYEVAVDPLHKDDPAQIALKSPHAKRIT